MSDLPNENLVLLPSVVTKVTSCLFFFWIHGCILCYSGERSNLFYEDSWEGALMVWLWYLLVLYFDWWHDDWVRDLPCVCGQLWYWRMINNKLIEVMWASRRDWSLFLVLFVLVRLGPRMCLMCKEMEKRPGRGRGDPNIGWNEKSKWEPVNFFYLFLFFPVRLEILRKQ